jgi:glycosyltransferase involved in cell wall biosynthesis
MQLVWMGSQDNWKTLDILNEALDKIDDFSFTLKTISNHPDADVAWDVKTVEEEILTGDIAVIPAFDNDWGKAKSNNRLTTFMALGMPVIASRIPSYNKIIKHGNNGFLADNVDSWVKHLLQLKDVEMRRKIGAQARKDVVSEYNIDVIGKRWIEVLNKVLTNKR